jgi:hypothetical protein
MPFHIRDALPSPSRANAVFITSAVDSCIPLPGPGAQRDWSQGSRLLGTMLGTFGG